jgi:hypothetical protein
MQNYDLSIIKTVRKNIIIQIYDILKFIVFFLDNKFFPPIFVQIFCCPKIINQIKKIFKIPQWGMTKPLGKIKTLSKCLKMPSIGQEQKNKIIH